MNFQKRWTPTEDKLITKLREQGHTYKEIAEMVDRSPGGVHSRLNRLGVCILRRWTPTEDEELIRLRNDGVTYKECALLLDRSYSSVCHRISFLNITKPDLDVQRIRKCFNCENMTKMEG